MIKTLTKLAAAVAVLGFMAAAQALPLTFADRVGTITPGHPDGDATEIDYVNHLLSMAAGTEDDFEADNEGVHHYIKVTAHTGSVTEITEKNETGSGEGSGVGFLLAKYGNGGDFGGYVVWAINGDFEIDEQGLSHYNVFATSDRTVPDGGATVALLGVGLLGVAAMRRKVS